MSAPSVNIHTHKPAGSGIELRTAGIHPWEAAGRSASDLLPLAPDVQAIGETGLDFVRGASRSEQLRVLREQLALAGRLRLPVVLHCVRAFEPLMTELRGCDLRAVIFHGFIGSPEQARRAWERGYYLSFGERTFRSPKTLGALRAAPLDRIFCETDESDTPIGEIYRRTAEAKGIGTDALAQALWDNYRRIFEEHDR